MKILIADDHKIVRIGLSFIIREEYPRAEIAEAGNAAEVYVHIKSKHFDLVLMDLKMPDTDSMALLEQLLIIDPLLKILIVSLNPEKIFALRYIKSGAFGYVQKSEDDSVTKQAIRKVLGGKKYMSEDVVEMMAEQLRHAGGVSNPFEKLAKREFDVAMHFIDGLTPGEICAVMNLQAPTVSTYKNRVFDKLNIKSIHELMQLAKQYHVTG